MQDDAIADARAIVDHHRRMEQAVRSNVHVRADVTPRRNARSGANPGQIAHRTLRPNLNRWIDARGRIDKSRRVDTRTYRANRIEQVQCGGKKGRGAGVIIVV